jgi:hypothetical protein
MQHGFEQRLSDRLLGPATLNSGRHDAARAARHGLALHILGLIGWLAGNVPWLAKIGSLGPATMNTLVDVPSAAGKRAPTKSKRALASVPLTGLWAPSTTPRSSASDCSPASPAAGARWRRRLQHRMER